MPNTINLFTGYAGLLDEAYAQASLTAQLDGAAELITQGAHVNEMIIPTLTLSGLADYSRSDGYVDGNVALTNQTVSCNFDRGRMFTVDVLDDEQTAGIAFGRLAGEFIRTQVAPELDAFRFAQYAAGAGASVTGNLTTGAGVIAALRAASSAMDNAQVPMEERALFITSALLGLIEDMETTQSRAVLDRFNPILRVHPGRFYSGIVQLDGTSAGEAAGGFEPAEGAAALNFLVVHKDAVIQFTRHAQPKVIQPGDNQTADAWKFGYRLVGIAQVYASRTAGIYVHKQQVE
jgi:hypothetical protein